MQLKVSSLSLRSSIPAVIRCQRLTARRQLVCTAAAQMASEITNGTGTKPELAAEVDSLKQQLAALQVCA